MLEHEHGGGGVGGRPFRSLDYSFYPTVLSALVLFLVTQ